MSSFRIKSLWAAVLGFPVLLFMVYRLAIALTAFNPAEQPIGYVAQDEMTNYNLKSGNEVLFRGQYEREFWSGTLLAYKIDSAGNLQAGTSQWTNDAAGMVDQQNFDTGRLIGTMKDDGTKIPFRWDNLSAIQQGYLTSSDILNFLRGDRSNELPATGKTLRQRASVMGDVVHSRPFYVADATNPTVFVGANDGMLHAINAGTGSTGGMERWAYVPSMLLSKMQKLSASPYVHDYYVDGQINVGTISNGTKRMLVGGLGSGGKGLYALDITGSAGLTATTDSQVASKAMWEITPTQVNYSGPSTNNAYVNLGYTYGTVTLAKVGGVDAVIVGNGYNDGVGNYAACSAGTPNYSNCGGNYAAYLYVINATTGQLIKAMKAGVNGTALSPNGLSTPVAVDRDEDGSVDTVYAGDLNGTMWKFDLVNGVIGTELLTTSPAQPITATPGIGVHPDGGYMVTFGTGRILEANALRDDTTDTSVHYVYGVWDGAPVSNAALVEQTITERAYTVNGVTTRVRRSTSVQPNWSSGSGNHRGWKVALPSPGERVLGEGSFIENGRFYFTTNNPTISNPVPGTDTIVKGEAWLMELDYLTGGSKDQPFLDLSGNVKLDDDDRIKYTDTDVLPVTTPATVVGDPIKGTAGIPVGKFISIGLLSQPVLVQLVTLNDTLFNQNPDVVVPTVDPDRGIKGGHFDVEIYHGSTVTAGTAATATITVGTGGETNPYPATLGGIQVNGVTIVPALTTTDLPKVTDTVANASKIRSKVTGGFTATVLNNVVTIKAPVGAAYEGATMTIVDGTSSATLQPQVTAQTPTQGSIRITDATRSTTATLKCGSTTVASGGVANSATLATRLDGLATSFSKTLNNYVTACSPIKDSGGVTTALACTINAPAAASACSGGFTPSNLTVSNNVGPSGGRTAIAQSGFVNLAPGLTATAFTGGSDAARSGDDCTSVIRGVAVKVQCEYKQHEHEYDDIYDRTGVNFLDASNAKFDLGVGVPSTATRFKVLMQNQYLSGAARLHIGNPAYQFDVNQGYIAVKNYQTTATLDLSAVPTYTRNTIGSLAINLPADAFVARDWWSGGNGLPPDVRDGVHPTEAACVFKSKNAVYDGNMYQPVIPPATVTASGNGTLGYSSSTTETTAQGVRHNGAISIQIIRENTPATAIELSVPGRPEYGWRVKAADYATYVLTEYSMFHHTKHLGLCYGDAKWTKTPVQDKRLCASRDTSTTKQCAADKSATVSTDPRIGDLGGGLTAVTTTTTVVGNVTTTTINYGNGLFASIVRTANADGSITIVTRDSTCTADSTCQGVTKVVANTEGAVKTGGNERGLQARTGRISWRELVSP